MGGYNAREVTIPDEPRVVFEEGHVGRLILLRHAPSDAAWYLCGSPRMQESVLAELQACGIDPASVEKERFAFGKQPVMDDRGRRVY